MILATDGIESGFAEAVTAGGAAQDIADRILARHAREADDALVVVVRYVAPDEARIRVAGDADVAAAARAARGLAAGSGLTGVEAQHVATAVSEIARNAVKYADGGEVELAPAEHDGRSGLRIAVRDRGPGHRRRRRGAARRDVDRRIARARAARRAAADGRLRDPQRARTGPR